MAITYVAIATTTVGAGGAASIDFTSIPATYTDLILKTSIRTNQSAPDDYFKITLNGSSSNFTTRVIDGNGSTAASYSYTTSPGSQIAGQANGNTSTASTFANSELYITNYAGSNNKSFSHDGVTENNATYALAELGAHLWSNVAAITSISIAPYYGTSFSQYSTATLYGIKNS